MKILSHDSPREDDESRKIAGIPATIGTGLISSVGSAFSYHTEGRLRCCGAELALKLTIFSYLTGLFERVNGLWKDVCLDGTTLKNTNVPRATLEPTTCCSSGERGCMPVNYTTTRTIHALKKCARSRRSVVATGWTTGE